MVWAVGGSCRQQQLLIIFERQIRAMHSPESRVSLAPACRPRI